MRPTNYKDIFWFFDKKTNCTYLSVLSFPLRYSLVFAFHVGDRVQCRGRNLVIRKFSGDRAFCYDTKTRFGCWFELVELEVTDENKMV